MTQQTDSATKGLSDASDDAASRTRIWFDTEFIEDGRTIDLLSIGLVREDGETFYAEPQETDHTRASDWVITNVLPHLHGPLMPRAELMYQLREFCGPRPEFWAYYADYDWVALCQLFGRMIDLPRGWPMYCRDVKQLCDSLGNPRLPKQSSAEHNALNDAIWTRAAWQFLHNSAARVPAPFVAESAQIIAEFPATASELQDRVTMLERAQKGTG